MQMIHPNEQHMSRLVKFFVVIAILYLLWMTLFQPDGGIADSTTYQSSQ
jgi:multisubunit Na+/H+ antiporter MnhB subunit